MRKIIGSNFNFKNRIINGDMQVDQRGKIHYLNNRGEYTLDRWYSEIRDGSMDVRQEFIFSSNSGSKVSVLDIFGDNSCEVTYTFDKQDANDLSGKYNGNWVGNEQYDLGIYDGYAAKFDGESYINTGFKTRDLIKNRSFSLWVKANPDDNADNVEFFGNRSVSNRCGVSLFWYKKKNKLTLASSGGSDFIGVDFYGINKIINNWVHICGVYENGYQTLYINGNKIGTSSLGSKGDDNLDIYIGAAKSNGINGKLKGLIDQVRIFNKPLTVDEVRKPYVEDSKYIFKTYLKSTVITNDGISKYTPFVYRFESQHLLDLFGSDTKATLSFLFASNKNRNFSIKLLYPDGSEFKSFAFNYTRDKKFKKITQTINFNEFDMSKITANEDLGLELRIVDNSDVNANDWVSITDVQLEKGTVATEFEQVPFDVQLHRCRRYYEKVYGFVLRDDAGDGIRTQTMSYPFEVEKRVTPAINIINNSSTSNTDKHGVYGVTRQNVELGGEFRNKSVETTFVKLDFEADAEL